MMSLHAAGCARLVFHPGQNPVFEGVLITDDTDETFGIIGQVTKNEGPVLVDVTVTDGETGQLYIIRRVELKTLSAGTDKNMNFECLTPLSTPDQNATPVDTDVDPKALSHTPHYELYSEVLKFTTEELLVGNRADRDISTYLNPDWVGKQLRVHVGPMSIHFSTAITPPASPTPDRRHHHISICCAENGAVDGDDKEEKEITDADINFLM